METRQIFLVCVVMAELFPSSLYGIAASVRHVSSIIVVLNAKLARLIAAHANKNGVKRRIPTRVPFLLVETHKRSTSIAVFTVQAETSLLYFPTIYVS